MSNTRDTTHAAAAIRHHVADAVREHPYYEDGLTFCVNVRGFDADAGGWFGDVEDGCGEPLWSFTCAAPDALVVLG